ncbi:MAG: ABC transporter permease, partial [Vicinamibacterales bacterium]
MRWYAALLRLFPRSFRDAYGDEMTAAARTRLRDAGSAGGRAAAVAACTWDAVAAAAGVHADLLRQDLSTAVRSLRRAPGYAAAAVFVAALGIGATTAAVAVTDHVLIRPLPFPDPGRLVKIYQDQGFRGYARMELSPPNFLDFRRESRSFSGLAAYAFWSFNLTGVDEPLRIDGITATSDLFSVLGVPAALGRTLTSIDDDPGAPLTVVLSHRLWSTAFGGRPDALGQTLILDDAPHTVVGVMPPHFVFPDREVSLWVPLRFTGDTMADRANWYLNSVARLADGTSIEAARTEMNGIAAVLARAYPDTNARNGATVVRLRDELSASSRLLLWALVGAALCMLLIACTNLAGLFLARSLSRQADLSIRVALGAGRERLVRQLLVEHLLLALCGGAVGVTLAVFGTPVIARLVPTSLPIAETPAADLRLMGFALLLTLATGWLFGAIPARRLAGQASIDGLREAGRTGPGRATERTRGWLVCAEIAASLVLLVSAGLLIQALWRVQQVDPGFDATSIVTLRTSLPADRYSETAVRERFYDRVLTTVRALPGVTGAAYISQAPMAWGGGIWPVAVDGEPQDTSSTYTANLRMISPAYFETLGIPLREGRDLRPSDTLDTPRVALVSESFVERHWPGQTAVGRTVSLADDTFTVV